MADNTNLQNLDKLLTVYQPKEIGVVAEEERLLIEETLELETMSIMELRNLQDFVIVYLSRQAEGDSKSALAVMDKMSAIISVIHLAIINHKDSEEFMRDW